MLASGTIEATRLAMESVPTPLMGRNLMGHLRSNTVVRIHRSALDPALPKQLEAAALLVRDSNGKGRYHLQVTAAAVAGANSEATMWRAEILRAADPSRLQRATLSRCFNLL